MLQNYLKYRKEIIMSIRKPRDIDRTPLSHTITWIVCRSLLLVWGIAALFLSYNVQFLLAIFAIIFTFLWDMFQLWGGKTFITKVPYSFQTKLNIFICFGCVVGTTVNKLTTFEHIDILTHFLSGVISASVAFDLALIVQGKKRPVGVALASMFALCAAMTVAVGWEFYEFSMDRLYGLELQTSLPLSDVGLVDTMVDFIVCSAGAITAMLFSAFKFVGYIGKNKAEVRAEYLLTKQKLKSGK